MFFELSKILINRKSVIIMNTHSNKGCILIKGHFIVTRLYLDVLYIYFPIVCACQIVQQIVRGIVSVTLFLDLSRLHITLLALVLLF